MEFIGNVTGRFDEVMVVVVTEFTHQVHEGSFATTHWADQQDALFWIDVVFQATFIVLDGVDDHFENDETVFLMDFEVGAVFYFSEVFQEGKGFVAVVVTGVVGFVIRFFHNQVSLFIHLFSLMKKEANDPDSNREALGKGISVCLTF
jgi:hypothetical protein